MSSSTSLGVVCMSLDSLFKEKTNFVIHYIMPSPTERTVAAEPGIARATRAAQEFGSRENVTTDSTQP